MEPYRPKHRVARSARIGTRRSQGGITLIGFLILAGLIGLVGFGGIKLVPVYMQNMRLDTVLNDVHSDLDGRNPTPAQIRSALNRRFSVEGIRLPPESVTIEQGRNGYQVGITYENRTPYIADIWLLVTFDKQVEIRR